MCLEIQYICGFTSSGVSSGTAGSHSGLEEVGGDHHELPRVWSLGLLFLIRKMFGKILFRIPQSQILC